MFSNNFKLSNYFSCSNATFVAQQLSGCAVHRAHFTLKITDHIFGFAFVSSYCVVVDIVVIAISHAEKTISFPFRSNFVLVFSLFFRVQNACWKAELARYFSFAQNDMNGLRARLEIVPAKTSSEHNANHTLAHKFMFIFLFLFVVLENILDANMLSICLILRLLMLRFAKPSQNTFFHFPHFFYLFLFSSIFDCVVGVVCCGFFIGVFSLRSLNGDTRSVSRKNPLIRSHYYFSQIFTIHRLNSMK